MGLPQQEVTQRFISFYGTTDKTNQGNQPYYLQRLRAKELLYALLIVF